jgi:hypothetical protein
MPKPIRLVVVGDILTRRVGLSMLVGMENNVIITRFATGRASAI